MTLVSEFLSPKTQEVINGHVDILGDLPQENRREVASLMEGDCRASPVGMTELPVRTALAHLNKTQCIQDGDDLAGL
jgi:hypothetical protein